MANQNPYIVPKFLSRPRNFRECVSELEREIAVRKRCYERWIRDGTLMDCDAADRFERLMGLLQFLTKAYPNSNEVAETFTNPVTRADIEAD